ncbi:MAG: AAA family ATPase [bacterium]
MDNKQKFQNYMLDLIKKGECGSYESRCRNFEFWDSLEKIIETITQKNIFQVNSTNELENILRILKRNLDWKRFNAGHQNGIPYALLNKHYRYFISNNTNLTLQLENPRTNENKSSDLDKLREELIQFGESLNSERFDRNDGQSTVLKVKNSYDKQFVAVHFDNANKNGVRIRLSNKYVSEKLKNRTEIENYEKNFNLKFLVKSADDLNIAKELIKNSIENAIEIENNFNDIDTLLKKYKELKNSSEYNEQYKWDYAIKTQGVFQNLDNLNEKIKSLGSQNFQSFFMRNSGIKWMAEKHPDILMSSFESLFNNSMNLEDRIKGFRDSIKDTLNNDEGWKNKGLTDPGIDTASFFLFTNDYKNLLLFTKIKPFNNYAKKFSIDYLLKFEDYEKRYTDWINYCNKELIPKMNEVLNKENDLLDAQDFIWFVGNQGNIDLNAFRESLLEYGKSLGATINETEAYTALKTKNNIAEVHKISDKSKQFRVLVSYDKLDEELKNITEKVPDSYQWTLNGSFYVNSEETLEQAKELIAKVINKTENDFNVEENIMNNSSIPLNQILYGPPGTGKTYQARKLVETILSPQLNIPVDEKLKLSKILENMYWYQALALTMYRNGENRKYKVKDLIDAQEIQIYSEFKNSKDLPPTLWVQLNTRTSPDSTTVKTNKDSRIYPYLFDKTENSEWFLTDEGKKYVHEELSEVLNELKETKQFEIKDFYEFITFHQSYSYEEFVEGIKPVLTDSTETNESISYKLEDGVFKKICLEAKNNPNLNFVLLIDEINRGNISKIFGELITLVEDTKRLNNKEAINAQLPYSKKSFGVPNNLYIIGTMNTSDRSIASVDIALRRRFKFIEIMPDSSLVPIDVEGVKVREIFENLNQKISILLDRDHQIGHSYFIGVDSIEKLERIWFDNVIPLLNEYFYGEWDKLQTILGDFISVKDVPPVLKDIYDDNKYYDFKKPEEIDFIQAIKKLENNAYHQTLVEA